MPVLHHRLGRNGSAPYRSYVGRRKPQVDCLPVIADRREDLEESLNNALSVSDIVLLNGGTSMGTEDFTAALLQSQSSYFRHGVRCIPGLPVATAMIAGKPVVNLPGPPYAAFCALDWCVKALIYHWYGMPLPERRTIKAVLKKPVQKPPFHEMYVRVNVCGNAEEGYAATPLPRDIRITEAAERWNGWFIAPIGQNLWEAGCEVEVELLYTDC